MVRKQNETQAVRFTSLVLLLVGLISCAVVYSVVSTILRPSTSPSGTLSSELVRSAEKSGSVIVEQDSGSGNGGCCRGIDHLELWGSAVKWGSEFKFNSSELCCKACKEMCGGNAGPCLCDSWVFCGDKEACGSKFGECWLKKQKDVLAPDKQEVGEAVMWTSGIIFGGGEGIVGIKTEYGTLRIKLYPDCSPRSVAYILELLYIRHCAGCEFYRAESRGQSWDSEGNHIKDSPLGPPFALIQGILEADGMPFPKIPTEDCPTIRRGSIAWVGSGPEFFISLANHPEWNKVYTVFGSVLQEDMEIVEKIASLPTQSDVWNNINVSVLQKPVPLSVGRLESSQEV